MPKLIHEKSGRVVNVPADKVESYTSKGWKAEARQTKKPAASGSKSDD